MNLLNDPRTCTSNIIPTSTNDSAFSTRFRPLESRGIHVDVQLQLQKIIYVGNYSDFTYAIYHYCNIGGTDC